MPFMDSIYLGEKIKEVIKIGFTMLVLILLCIGIITAFAASPNIKEESLSSNKLNSMENILSSTILPHSTPQTTFLQELDNVHGAIGQSATYVSLSTEKAILSTTGIPETSSSHPKRRHLVEKEGAEKATRRRAENGETSHRKGKIQHKLQSIQKSCPVQKSVVSKKTAEDIFGNIVDVYPVIYIGKLALDQLFYESFCAEEKCPCAGVNNKKFKSSCQTTYTNTYARIVKGGEIGWSYIKTRSGCSCFIQERNNE